MEALLQPSFSPALSSPINRGCTRWACPMREQPPRLAPWQQSRENTRIPETREEKPRLTRPSPDYARGTGVARNQTLWQYHDRS